MTDSLVSMLVNRVRKNRRQLKAWLRREQVACYRLYDRDIPELPLAIDWYDVAAALESAHNPCVVIALRPAHGLRRLGVIAGFGV